MTHPAPPLVQPLTGTRWPRAVAATLFGLEGLLLMASVPMVLLMILGSGWEGGDEQLKHRIIAWGPTSLPLVLIAVVLSFAAAVSVSGAKHAAVPLALSTAGLVLALGAGWGWVWQQDLFSDGTVLGFWLVWTMPPVVAAVLAFALPSPPPTTVAAETSVGVEP